MDPPGAPSGVSFEWLAGKRIAVFTIKDVTRDTVDKWMRGVTELIDGWPKGMTYLVMQDASDKRISLTPYARPKIIDLYRRSSHLKGRVAVVLPKTFAAQAMQIFLRIQRRHSLITEVFFSRIDAEKWLEHGLPAEARIAK